MKGSFTSSMKFVKNYEEIQKDSVMGKYFAETLLAMKESLFHSSSYSPDGTIAIRLFRSSDHHHPTGSSARVLHLGSTSFIVFSNSASWYVTVPSKVHSLNSEQVFHSIQ